MAIACCVCTAVWFIWLAHQASTSLVLTGGFLAVLLLLHSPSGWSLRSLRKDLGKKMDKVANGEAHRQEVGVISSGSYQNHFLYDLSDAKRERKRDRKEMRMSETFWKENKSWCPQVFPHETWLSKLNQTNLWSHSSLSSHGKLMQCINETQCWTNEEQNSNDNGVNRGKWP